VTVDELQKMCDKLSYKYKTSSMREDLSQEGLVACLEILDKEPNAHPAKLYRAADKAMWDYLNFDSVAVAVPKTHASRAVIRGADLDATQTYSGDGLEALEYAIKASKVEYDDTYMMVEDHATAYEEKEFARFVSSKVSEVLDSVDLKIIRMRYNQDMTLEEVGSALGLSKQAVSKRETDALEKLKRRLKQFVN
jgi:RNA polymerase sigma factor (sigma-70 family)